MRALLQGAEVPDDPIAQGAPGLLPDVPELVLQVPVVAVHSPVLAALPPGPKAVGPPLEDDAVHRHVGPPRVRA